jgi:hypothetical protein
VFVISFLPSFLDWFLFLIPMCPRGMDRTWLTGAREIQCFDVTPPPPTPTPREGGSELQRVPTSKSAEGDLDSSDGCERAVPCSTCLPGRYARVLVGMRRRSYFELVGILIPERSPTSLDDGRAGTELPWVRRDVGCLRNRIPERPTLQMETFPPR